MPPIADLERASPMVRRLARERGIDLKLVKGSGPEGRILQEDLEGFLRMQGEGKTEIEGKPATPEQPEHIRATAEERPLSRMRVAIARTVSEAWRTIPHFAVTDAIEMGEAERVRRELKEAGTALSVNDVIVKAAAMALAKFPLVNGSFAGESMVLHGEINIGIAVGLEEGLLVPVIGNTYAGASLVGLSAVLDVAQPGERIFVCSFGSGAGSDAFIFNVTDKIEARRDLAPKTQDYIARRTPIDYATYTRYRGEITME